MKPRLALTILLACIPASLNSTTRAEDAATPLALPDFREVIARAKARVFPAVIYIKCIRESMESGKKESQEISGSGVIMSAGGEALTNWHVVDKAIEIRCQLTDGRAAGARILGKDKDTDLALIQLELSGGGTVPYATLGDSVRLTEGDVVMAMGAPWGLNRSVSLGIISCTRRFLPEHSEYSLWLQTDAAISPGNSGGPLVNSHGEVVGLNTRGVMVGGDMGFTVPSETIRDIVTQLRNHGEVKWSWTGLQLQALRDFNRNIYFDADEGVIVAETDPESPARHAGLQPKDRIIRINDRPVIAMTEEDLPQLRREIGLLPKNQPASIVLVRGEKTMQVELTPREKGKVEGEELECKRWDFTVKAINQFDNPGLYFHRKEGVFVYGIKYPGNASNSDLSEQDIILKIEGKPVTRLDDVRTMHEQSVAEVHKKHKLVLQVLRNGLFRQVILDFSRDYEKE